MYGLCNNLLHKLYIQVYKDPNICRVITTQILSVGWLLVRRRQFTCECLLILVNKVNLNLCSHHVQKQDSKHKWTLFTKMYSLLNTDTTRRIHHRKPHTLHKEFIDTNPYKHRSCMYCFWQLFISALFPCFSFFPGVSVILALIDIIMWYTVIIYSILLMGFVDVK